MNNSSIDYCCSYTPFFMIMIMIIIMMMMIIIIIIIIILLLLLLLLLLGKVCYEPSGPSDRRLFPITVA